jgi:Thiolase, C-terminal domain
MRAVCHAAAYFATPVQVLSNLAAMDSDKFCKESMGRSGKIGAVPMEKLNTMGGSLSLGHPFGATGTRYSGASMHRAVVYRGSGLPRLSCLDAEKKVPRLSCLDAEKKIILAILAKKSPVFDTCIPRLRCTTFFFGWH